MTAQDWVIIIGAIATATVAIIGAIGTVLLQVRTNTRLIEHHMNGTPPHEPH